MSDNFYDNENLWQNTLHPEKMNEHPTINTVVYHHKGSVFYETEYYYAFIAHVRAFHGKGFMGCVRFKLSSGSMSNTEVFYGTDEKAMNLAKQDAIETTNKMQKLLDNQVTNYKEEKKGYKGTYNYVCRGHEFKIGETYELSGKPLPCFYGFHYCKNAKDVLKYYPHQYNFKLLEIEDLGDSETEYDKTVTNKIRIVREITDQNELLNLIGFYVEYNMFGNVTYYKSSDGYWQKNIYDENNRLIKSSSKDDTDYNDHGLLI
jgi:hypothetical protein